MLESRIYFSDCNDPACENCEYRLHSDCLFCGRSLEFYDYAIHVYYEAFDDSRYVGEVCYFCREHGTDSLREFLTHRRDRLIEASERDDEEYRKLVMQGEQLREHLKWLESKTLHVRQRLGHFSRFVKDLTIFASAQIDWSKEGFRQRHRERRYPPGSEADISSQRLIETSIKRSGFVYLIRSDQGYFKIGRSRDVPTRFNTLKIQLPFNISLVHSIETSDAVWAEKYLHDQFHETRMNGEWFALAISDVEYICSLKTLEPGGDN